MRALVITMADVGIDRLLSRCETVATNKNLAMLRKADQAREHFDPLRDDATTVLVSKYAPFMARQPRMAMTVVEPVVEVLLDQFAMDELSSDACAQASSVISAIMSVPPSHAATMLTALATEQARNNPQSDMIAPCPDAADSSD